MNPFNTSDLNKLLISPFYCIEIDEHLTIEHEPLISEELWIAANIGLIREIGVENWLRHLLEILQGDYVGGPLVCDDCTEHYDCA